MLHAACGHRSIDHHMMKAVRAAILAAALSTVMQGAASIADSPSSPKLEWVAPFASNTSVTLRVGVSCTHSSSRAVPRQLTAATTSAAVPSSVSFMCEIAENATGRVIHREEWVNATGCGTAVGDVDVGVNVMWVETRSITPTDPTPTPWSPRNPFLYTMRCSATSTSLPRANARSSVDGDTLTSRFGFRSFTRDAQGRLRINGDLVFLRGNSINPPGRWGLPAGVSETHAFARDFLTFMKRNASVNAVRIGDGAIPTTEAWYDAADELGMLIYAGPYGNPRCPGCRVTPAVDPPPPGSEDVLVATYEEVLRASASHPSHVIMILTNELDFNVDGHHGYSPYGPQYAALIHNVTERLRSYDPARLYIGNAGFGQGKGGDILDDHAYYGWYNGDTTSFYSDATPISNQPYTFTECVGNYITVGGDFDVSGKNLAWSLKWTGLVQGGGEGAEHLRKTTKESLEVVRRFRSVNGHLAGIMPFSSPFYVCGEEVTSFDDMLWRGEISPSVRQMTTSFAPLLVSAELWMRHVSAKSSVLRGVVHIVNDADDGSTLAAGWSVRLSASARISSSKMHARGHSWEQPDTEACASWTLRNRACDTTACEATPLPAVPYFENAATLFQLSTVRCAPGVHTLAITLVSASGDEVAFNQEEFEIFSSNRPRNANNGNNNARKNDTTSRVFGNGLDVVLVDTSRAATARALTMLGVPIEVTLTDLASLPMRNPTTSVVVIGEDAWSPTVDSQRHELGAWVARGGRVLVMQQSNAAANLTLDWAPVGAALRVAPKHELVCQSGATKGCLAVAWGQPLHITRSGHPIFTSPHVVTPQQLAQWNDYTGWSESNRSGGLTPRLSPVAQALTIDTSTPDPRLWATVMQFRRQSAVIAAHAIGLQHQVVVEMRGSSGSGGGGDRGGGDGGVVVFFGIDAVRRVGVDPVAERVLENVLAYVRNDGIGTTSDTHDSTRSVTNSVNESTPLQPLFTKGDTITWGDYSSERGVAVSNLEGMLVQSCPYNASCSNGWLGNKACGRTPLGPFNWTFMGHNTDLEPDNTTAWAVLWATTVAGVSKIVTTWLPPPSPPRTLTHGLYDSRAVLITPSRFQLSIVDSRTWLPGSAYACAINDSAHEAVCTVPVPSGSGGTIIEMHMTMPKGATLLTTSFH